MKKNNAAPSTIPSPDETWEVTFMQLMGNSGWVSIFVDASNGKRKPLNLENPITIKKSKSIRLICKSGNFTVHHWRDPGPKIPNTPKVTDEIPCGEPSEPHPQDPRGNWSGLNKNEDKNGCYVQFRVESQGPTSPQALMESDPGVVVHISSAPCPHAQNAQGDPVSLTIPCAQMIAVATLNVSDLQSSTTRKKK